MAVFFRCQPLWSKPCWVNIWCLHSRPWIQGYVDRTLQLFMRIYAYCWYLYLICKPRAGPDIREFCLRYPAGYQIQYPCLINIFGRISGFRSYIRPDSRQVIRSSQKLFLYLAGYPVLGYPVHSYLKQRVVGRLFDRGPGCTEYAQFCPIRIRVYPVTK